MFVTGTVKGKSDDIHNVKIFVSAIELMMPKQEITHNACVKYPQKLEIVASCINICKRNTLCNTMTVGV